MNHIKMLLATSALAFVASVASAQSANVTPTTVGVSGTNVTNQLISAAGLLYIPNDGKTIAILRGGATAVTATVVTQKTSVTKDGYGTITIGNETVSIPSVSTVAIGPFPSGRFNTTTGVVTISLSSVVGVSATAIKLP